MREQPANLRWLPTAKLLAILDADWSVCLPRIAPIGYYSCTPDLPVYANSRVRMSRFFRSFQGHSVRSARH
jgi:hypothetical protein